MTCFECHGTHAVMWTYVIRCGRNVTLRVFCNLCELGFHRAA